MSQKIEIPVGLILDPRMSSVLFESGIAALGLYVQVLCLLRSADGGRLSLAQVIDQTRPFFSPQEKHPVALGLLARSGLLVLEDRDQFVRSPELDEQISRSDQKSAAAKRSIASRWEKVRSRACARRKPKLDTNVIRTNNERNTNEERPSEIPENLRTPECEKAIRDWYEHKKFRKEEYSPVGWRRQLATFAGWGPERTIAAVNLSVTKPWKGCYEPTERDQSIPAAAATQRELQLAKARARAEEADGRK